MKPRPILFFFALVALAFIQPAFAADAATEARQFVPYSQWGKVSVAPLPDSGGAYLASVAKEASFVLVPDGKNYSLEEDYGKLKGLLGGHCASVLAKNFNETALELLSSGFSGLESNFTRVDAVTARFLKNTQLIYFILQVDDRGAKVLLSKIAVDRLGGNGTVPSNSEILKDGFEGARKTLGDIDTSEVPNLTKGRLAQINATLAVLYPVAQEYESDFNLISSRHYMMVEKTTSDFVKYFTPVFSGLSVLGRLCTAEELAGKLANGSAAHADYFKIHGLANAEWAKIDALSQRYSAAQIAFRQKAYLSFSLLDDGLSQIMDEADELERSESLANATAIVHEIDSELEAAAEKLDYMDGILIPLENATVEVGYAYQDFPAQAKGLKAELEGYQVGIRRGEQVPMEKLADLSARAMVVQRQPPFQVPGLDSPLTPAFASVTLVSFIVSWYFLNRKRAPPSAEKIEARKAQVEGLAILKVGPPVIEPRKRRKKKTNGNGGNR
jgi:hypothetical protein